MDIDRPEELEAFRADWRDEVAYSRNDNHVRQREMSEATSTTLRPMSSAESTEPTIRSRSESQWLQTPEDYLSADDRMDVEDTEAETSSDFGSGDTSFIIATDFGTTFSSVAFTKVYQGRAEPAQNIINYPDELTILNTKKSSEVPTEIWYPIASAFGDYEDNTPDIPNDEDADDAGESNDEDDIGGLLQYLRNDGNTEERLTGSRVENQASRGGRNQESIEGDKDVPDFLWGYQTQAMMHSGDVDRSHFKCIARSKLILDESPRTQIIRDELRPILNQLRHMGIIKKDEDVITHYITQLFLHAKKQLIIYHEFSESCPVKHVLCVPNIWSPKACRTMQKAMEAAIQRSGLGSLENLFIISEPEAAATFVIHNDSNISINPDDTFVILDAGGGTVDATTYTVRNQFPLRLKSEAVESGGGLYGSSYLNEAYRKDLLDRLKDEQHLEVRGLTIESIVNDAMMEFETRQKRVAHYANKKNPNRRREIAGWQVKVPGLRENSSKRFFDNRMTVEHADIAKIFDPLLAGITRLMSEQILESKKAGLSVQKVILIGGFAGSPVLEAHLRKKLSVISSNAGQLIDLVVPQSSCDVAVSLGAILRTLEKGDELERIAKSSYGFLRTEPHEPEVFQAHKEVRCTVDKLDGKRYVRNTIDWLVKKGESLPPRREYSIPVEHTFPLGERAFKCEEVLYVSDTSTRSHYRVTHPNNKGAEIAGSIIADMTFLKTEGFIQPVIPEPGEGGKPHYKVEFELVMIVDGRNLRFEARDPTGGGIQARGYTSIAAAFEPGTK